MKYLVTGCPGWLGTRFLRALTGNISELSNFHKIEEEDEIRCLVLDGIDSEVLESIDSRIKIFRGNLTNKDTMHDFFSDSSNSIIFHMAGLIHPRFFTRQIYAVNQNGSQNVLDLAIKNGCKRMIAVSSNSPIGVNPSSEHLFDEDSPYNPYMAYGKSKMNMEIMLNDAFSRDKIETVILRPCWFYGPDQPPRQTLFFNMIKNGKAPIIGGGNSKRSMSYVDNTCQALLLSIKNKKASGQTYWIADEKPYTMNDVVDTVENLLENEFNTKCKHKRLRLPNLASGIAYYTDFLSQSFGIYLQKVHVLSEMNKTIACSIDKAKIDLGYKPHIGLEEGMRRSISWCLENGQNI